MLVKLRASIALIFFMIGTIAVAKPEISAQDPDNELVEHRLTLDVDRSLNFSVSKTWIRDREAKAPMGSIPTIQFRPEDGKRFSVQFSVITSQTKGPSKLVDQLAKSILDEYASQSVEKDLKLKPLKGVFGVGQYLSATDPAPKPGEYKFVTSGVMPAEELIVLFTVLTNDDQQAVVDAALKSVVKMNFSTKLELQKNAFAVPNQSWAVEFLAPDLNIYQSQSGRDRYRVLAGAGRMNVSIHVEPRPAESDKTHKSCFENYWPKAIRNPMIDSDSIKITEAAGYYRVQYATKKDPRGIPKLTHVNYYLAHEDRWIDVHVSFVEGCTVEDEIWQAIDKSLAIAPLKSKTAN
ncbi:MAG: hypothetical protein U0930_21805 [Pirellulales bacterium]